MILSLKKILPGHWALAYPVNSKRKEMINKLTEPFAYKKETDKPDALFRKAIRLISFTVHI